MKRNIRTEAVEEPKPQPQEMTKNDFFEAVHGVTATKPSNGKKDKMETLSPPDEIKKKVDEIVKWKTEEKKAKAERETREFTVIEWAQGVQEKEAFEGNYQKSFRIPGVKELVTFVTADKFSAIKPEDVEPLKEVLGPKFKELITQKTIVALKAEVLSDPALQAELMSLLGGKEKFSKFFISETTFLTMDGFDQKRFSLPKKIYEKVMEFVKQSKPSIK